MEKNKKTYWSTTLKSIKKYRKRRDKIFRKKILKRYDIDPKKHILFIDLTLRKPERINKLIMEAQKRDRRKYLKRVKNFLNNAND